MSELVRIPKCATCGTAQFWSRNLNRIYCSLPCFIHSSAYKLSVLRGAPLEKPIWDCLQCGKTLPPNRSKFCNKHCYRTWFVGAFDRWTANPISLLAPSQGFLEFLEQDELPCLVPECEWRGTGLSHHCRYTHEIPARVLKELVGFNRAVGLIGKANRLKRSEDAKKRFERNVLLKGRDKALTFQKHFQHGPGVPKRPQGLQQQMKAANVSDHRCAECGEPFVAASVQQKFCCTPHSQAYSRRKIADGAICINCEEVFACSLQQLKRFNAGANVRCSACRGNPRRVKRPRVAKAS